jgi:hypothetical protein
VLNRILCSNAFEMRLIRSQWRKLLGFAAMVTYDAGSFGVMNSGPPT